MLAEKLCRPELIALEPYQSARRIGGKGEVWLNANESPFCNGLEMNINRYPDPQPEGLMKAYCQYADVTAEQAIVTRGADEAIELLIRTFCVPGKDSITYLAPSYGMYAISAITCGVATNAVDLDDNFLPPRTLADSAQNSKLLFVCNPNNPTGTLIEPDYLVALCQALPNTLVVVDEAYIEFCADKSMAQYVGKLPNLVVLRTLSKAFALAGARCGFALASEDVIHYLLKVIAPYPIPRPTATIAERALTIGRFLVTEQIVSLNAQREQLQQFLAQYPNCTGVLQSDANFIMASFQDADAIFDGLSAMGIITRRYSHPRLTDYIRFSIGSPLEMGKTMKALQSIVEKL